MESEILERLFESTKYTGNEFQIRVRNKALHIGFGICEHSAKKGEYFDNLKEAIHWLANEDVKRRPDSDFAKWWRETNESD